MIFGDTQIGWYEKVWGLGALCFLAVCLGLVVHAVMRVVLGFVGWLWGQAETEDAEKDPLDQTDRN